MSTVIDRLAVPRGRFRHGLFAICGLIFLGMSIPAFAEHMTYWTGIVLGDYIYPGHELHHFVLGTILPLLLLGVIVQAIYPTRRVAALHSSVLIWVTVTLVFSLGGAFSGVLLALLLALIGMVAFHPLGSDQLPTLDRLDRPMTVVAGITLIVCVVLAGIELVAHFTAVNGHVSFNHYLFMAIAWLSIGGLVLIGSLKPPGWWFAIYGAAITLAVIGGGSILYPGGEQGSSLGVWFGLVALVWSAVIVLTAERGVSILQRVR